MGFLRCAAASVLLVVASTAHAQMPPNISEGELALLPVFCADTMGMPKFRPTPGFEYWKGRLGNGFTAMHHYCWARINQRRLSVSIVDRDARQRTLGGLVNDLNYVINNSPPNFVLLPEVYSARAEVELQRGDPVSAMLSIDAARRLNPSYGPPYRLWGEYLASVGKRSEARDLLKIGLEYNPSDRELRERYLALGGDLSKIQPRAGVPASAPHVAASASVVPPSDASEASPN